MFRKFKKGDLVVVEFLEDIFFRVDNYDVKSWVILHPVFSKTLPIKGYLMVIEDKLVRLSTEEDGLVHFLYKN